MPPSREQLSHLLLGISAGLDSISPGGMGTEGLLECGLFLRAMQEFLKNTIWFSQPPGKAGDAGVGSKAASLTFHLA